jgi:pimeloyl-ACP methyl ester carboxylesterase
MVVLILVAIAAALAGVTLIGTRLIESNNPPAGRFVDVEGGRLHVVELGPAAAPPVLLMHGASGNLLDMKFALGDVLSSRYRVILVDRPGHGWSDRPGGAADASPAAQAALVHQAMAKLGVRKPVVVGHSWSGALVTAYALAYPDDVRGLVLLAPVTHRWEGGAGAINHIVAAPVIGPLLAYTLTMPTGYLLLKAGIQGVFAPQSPPPDYEIKTGVTMLLRPREFIANARDLDGLKAFVTRQMPHYPEIKVPVTIIAGDVDPVVHTDIHARALKRQIQKATLTVLTGAGHMVHIIARDRAVAAIDGIVATTQ